MNESSEFELKRRKERSDLIGAIHDVLTQKAHDAVNTWYFKPGTPGLDATANRRDYESPEYWAALTKAVENAVSSAFIAGLFFSNAERL